MLDTFKNFFNQEKTIIAGEEISPLSLGQVYILDLIDSPYLKGGKASFQDVFVTLWILKNPYSSLVEKINNSDFKFIQKEAKKLSKNKTIFDITKANNQISKFLNSNIILPEKFETKEKGKELATPWALFINTVLQKELKIDENKIWEMPIGKTLSYYYSIQEINGAEFVTEKDKEIWEQAKKITIEDILKMQEQNNV